MFFALKQSIYKLLTNIIRNSETSYLKFINDKEKFFHETFYIQIERFGKFFF